MDDNCKDCVYISALDKRLSTMEHKVSDLENRVNAVEKNAAVSEEQVKMIFKILNEIKDSIKLIGDKIDDIESKPAKKWDDTTRTVVAVVVTSIGTFILSKILK